MRAERRQYERFEVKEGRIALLNPKGPVSTIFGHICNVSIGGIGFRCVADAADLREPFELIISCTNPYFYLGRLTGMIVGNPETPMAAYNSLAPTCLGVKFDKINRDQLFKLESFIRNHSKGGIRWERNKVQRG